MSVYPSIYLLVSIYLLSLSLPSWLSYLSIYLLIYSLSRFPYIYFFVSGLAKAPAAKSAPSLAKVLRLPRNLRLTKAPRVPCSYKLAEPSCCCADGPCAETSPRPRRTREAPAPGRRLTEVVDVDADPPKLAEGHFFSAASIPPLHAPASCLARVYSFFILPVRNICLIWCSGCLVACLFNCYSLRRCYFPYHVYCYHCIVWAEWA